MTQPSVTLTEQDGALGVLPPSAGALYAVVGVATAGDIATPKTFAKVKDLVAAATTAGKNPGPTVEAGAHYIERYGRPIVFVRTAATNDGTDGTLDDDDFAGTAAPELDEDNAPIDDADVVLKFTTGGTTGIAGIVYQYSLDGGITFSAKKALGTALAITIAELGTEILNLTTALTVVTGDVLRWRAIAPLWNTTDLGAGLDALKVWNGFYEIIHVVGNVDATAFDAIETKIQSMAAAGKDHPWIGSFRMPNEGETEAQYKIALDAALGAKSTTYGTICAGAKDFVSSVSGRKYRRPYAFTYAAREQSVSEEVNTAAVNLGPLPGDIRDANGNPKHHDESANPGLDDSRACVARTWDDFPGVYVNRPRLFSSETSDFQLMPHRRVMNTAKRVLRAYLQRRLSNPIQVNKSTGFITEADALEIEAGANAILRDTLLQKPKASAAIFVLSRTDNVLSTKTLNGECRITPLAYPEQIVVDPIAYHNPALQIAA